MEEKKLSIATRRKMARAAKRTAKKRQLKKKLLAKRPKSPEKLKNTAKKAAKNVLVKKLTGGKSYSDLSITQKQTIDNKLKPAIIAKVAKKLLPKVRAKEKERLKRMRQKTDEQFDISKHKLSGGGEINVSGVNKNNKIEPLKFKNKEDAKKHSKKVGGKVIQDKDDNYYVEFTKIDGPVNEKIEYKNANEIKKQWKTEYPNDKFTFKKVRAKGNEFLMVLSPKGIELEKYQFVPKTGWTEVNENKENEENLKDLKAILDIAKMLSDKSHYFKGRGSKKEYIKMLVHKIKKLSESKKKKLMTRMDAYMKVRKPTLPKSRPMKNKKAYDRKELRKHKYD